MEVYPDQYPCPRLSPYSYVVDMGVLRTPMDGGYSRQRRLYDVMPHALALEFVLPVSLLFSWQTWVNRYAYQYFSICLTTYFASEKGVDATPTIARFTSELRIELVEKGYVKIGVDCEIAPTQEINTPPGKDWIIAGAPGSPSTDWVIAGDPAGPASDFILAGTPASPSQY
jgi:hypothetical protein